MTMDLANVMGYYIFVYLDIQNTYGVLKRIIDRGGYIYIGKEQQWQYIKWIMGWDNNIVIEGLFHTQRWL